MEGLQVALVRALVEERAEVDVVAQEPRRREGVVPGRAAHEQAAPSPPGTIVEVSVTPQYRVSSGPLARQGPVERELAVGGELAAVAAEQHAVARGHGLVAVGVAQPSATRGSERVRRQGRLEVDAEPPVVPLRDPEVGDRTEESLRHPSGVRRRHARDADTRRDLERQLVASARRGPGDAVESVDDVQPVAQPPARPRARATSRSGRAVRGLPRTMDRTSARRPRARARRR